MNRAAFEAAITDAFVDILGPDAGSLAAESNDLVSDQYLDSYSLLELAAEIEARFDLTVPEDSLTEANFRNRASLVDMVERLCRYK